MVLLYFILGTSKLSLQKDISQSINSKFDIGLYVNYVVKQMKKRFQF